MESEAFRRDGLLMLERYLCALERYGAAPRLPRSTCEALHALYREARRVYYILSEWMVFSVAEQEAYHARLNCLATYQAGIKI